MKLVRCEAEHPQHKKSSCIWFSSLYIHNLDVYSDTTNTAISFLWTFVNICIHTVTSIKGIFYLNDLSILLFQQRLIIIIWLNGDMSRMFLYPFGNVFALPSLMACNTSYSVCEHRNPSGAFQDYHWKNKTGKKIQTRYACSVNYTKRRKKPVQLTVKTTDIHSLIFFFLFFFFVSVCEVCTRGLNAL